MKETFDERSTEFIRDIYGNPDLCANAFYLSTQMAYFTHLNDLLGGIRLSKLYYDLGIPFPENYLIDYKFKVNEPVFTIDHTSVLNGSEHIVIDINVPDQPKLEKHGNDYEYTFHFYKEDK